MTIEDLEAYRRSALRPLDVTDAESHLPPWTRELLACLRARRRVAFVLRQAGMSTPQIALHLGVSSSRAQQLCASAERLLVAAARRGAQLETHAPAGAAHRCASPAPCIVPPHRWATMALSIDCLDLSARSCNGLLNVGAALIGQLVQCSQAQLLKVPNLGIKSYREITTALARLDLHLDMVVPSAAPPDVILDDDLADD